MIKKFLCIIASVVLASACEPQGIKPDDAGAPVVEDSGVQVGTLDNAGAIAGATLAGQNYAVSYEKGAINDPGNILSQKIVYFDYDSSDVREDYVELVKHHGKYLALNTTGHVRLEGHTDERGSREYNIALADRRAQAVKRLMMFEGAGSDQIIIISYGEEKPADFGHDEQAWSMNRRAELVYGE